MGTRQSTRAGPTRHRRGTDAVPTRFRRGTDAVWRSSHFRGVLGRTVGYEGIPRVCSVLDGGLRCACVREQNARAMRVCLCACAHLCVCVHLFACVRARERVRACMRAHVSAFVFSFAFLSDCIFRAGV